MPKVSKESASQGGDHGLVVDRSEDLDDYTVSRLTRRLRPRRRDRQRRLRPLVDDRILLEVAPARREPAPRARPVTRNDRHIRRRSERARHHLTLTPHNAPPEAAGGVSCG